MLGLVVVLAFSLGSCSKEDSKAELGTASLQAGLKAHAAGKLDEAAKNYNEALGHDPENKFAYYDLGLVAQTQGDTSAAENDYQLALNIDSSYVPALYNLAVLRTQAGDEAGAIQLYQHASAVDPKNANVHLNLGLLLIDSGQKKAGKAELAKAVQLDSTLADQITRGEPSGPRGPEPSQ